jgi:hypothetical protein
MTAMNKKSPCESSLQGIEPGEPMTENHTPEMNAKEDDFKPSLHGAAAAGKKERAFELSLPAVVTGMDADENKFREKTLLFSISSNEATLWLKSKVLPGAKLDVSLEIPKTLILESHLKLQLSGTVIISQADSERNGKKQLVSLRLDKKFKLLPIPLSVN